MPRTRDYPGARSANTYSGNMNHHILSVLVQNRPGVLARVSGLFARRGYNIESLAVGPTERPEVSRMTVVANAEDGTDILVDSRRRDALTNLGDACTSPKACTVPSRPRTMNRPSGNT